MVLALALAALFSSGVFLSYYFQNITQARIEAAFQKDSVVAARVSQLQGQLRSYCYFVSSYISTNNPRWLNYMETADKYIQKLQLDIEKLLMFSERKEVFNKLKILINDHMKKEKELVAAQRAGRIGRLSNEVLEKRKAEFDAMVEVLGLLSDIDTRTIEYWRAETDGGKPTQVFVIIGAGLISCGVLGIFLYFYIIKPMLSFQADAQAWELGQTWQYKKYYASPEMQNLHRLMADLTEKLNKEYKNKCDLSDFKTRLVSMVGHEFNNSLSIISTATELLKEKDPNAADKAALYHVIEGYCHMLGISVRNLLNLGRLESGRLAINMQKVVIDQIARESVNLLELLWKEKQITIRLLFPGHPVVVMGDQTALSLVMTNLVTNAIKYTPKGGHIDISLDCGPECRETVISVKDTGIGVSPEDQSKILSGFYRTENSRKMAKGFGVGLMLVVMILEGHGAKLEIDSEPGKGSKFSFKLASAKPTPGMP